MAKMKTGWNNITVLADKLQDEAARQAYLERIEELKHIVEEPVSDTAYLWDLTVEKYAVNIERVKRMLQTNEMEDQVSGKMFKHLDIFLKRCADAEFHIALVGAIKAGKSTLINALLGYELASTSVTPETASLTKFRHSQKDDYVKVTFYSEQEWMGLWKSANDSKADVFLEEYEQLEAENERPNWLGKAEETFECNSKDELVREIARWTSSKSPTHYFVKEVEVGLRDFDLPDGVVLVDTPGLDDVVAYRSNITREYIDRANAVLVCVRSDTLTGQEMATIYSVFANTRYHPEKVYIIATQLDTLNRPEKNWQAQSEEWLKYLKSKSCYGNRALAEQNLVAVSAYLYTLLKEQDSLDEDRFFELEAILPKFRISRQALPENYQRLMDFTHIELLKTKLQHEIIDNHKAILIEDIKGNYDLCKAELTVRMNEIQGQQEEIIEVSAKSIEEIRKKRKEYEIKLEDTKAEKEDLEKLLKQLKVMTTKRADELTSTIRALGGK